MRAVNLSLMGVIIVSPALLVIFTQAHMSGAKAGFILAFATGISNNVWVILSNLRTIELKGISLERTAEYRMLEREEGQPLDQDDLSADCQHGHRLPNDLVDWPSKGSIQVSDLRARYGPDHPDILKDVSFSVQGGQRVGIVGATGGGKSTLAKAFFFFVDITSGKIEIDGQGKLESNGPTG